LFGSWKKKKKGNFTAYTFRVFLFIFYGWNLNQRLLI
jgi:hypothetical protein